MIQDDEKYKSLRNTLRHLPRVKAKKSFEARLWNRIREAEKGVIEPEPVRPKLSPAKGWLENLFRPSFAPALALTVVLLITVVVYFAYFSKIGDESTEQSITSSDKQGEFLIYVKKEAGDSFSSSYPKEYSAITQEETGEERTIAPTEMPSDFLSKPDPTRTLESLKPDRVSEEQKIEMERSVDDKKGVDTRGEREEDGKIMKKESKIETKKEGKDSPYNIRDEDKNINEGDTEGYIEHKQEAPKIKADEKNKEVDQTLGKDTNRISRAVKDSLKTKTPKTEAEQEDSTDQK
ncbi:MAG: hypothetical protein L0Y79_06360 [Chlorobi bacterium]|nr:hypothetical protein [Chlorobiota bacterium]MCI0717082.1 hypothetical protein [Chlorobiota bacterium]